MSRLRIHKPKKQPARRWTERLTIESLADDGRGLARREGKVVFVRGALPGEVVVARSQRISRRFDEAELVELVQPSEERQLPACPHYADCGGCQLQHLSQDGQQQFKSQRLAQLLQRLEAAEAKPPLLEQSWAYRHRLRLSFERDRLGLRKSRSHEIVATPECRILRPALAEALRALYAERATLALLHSGEIELTEGEGEQIACRINLKKKPTASVLSRFLESFSLPLAGIASGEQLLGEYSVELRYPGSDWRFAPGDFTQINPMINTAITQQVEAWLSLCNDDYLLDAFCGLGNFARSLSGSGARILGLEADPAMVARARSQSPEDSRLRFEEANLFESSPNLPKGINKVLLDPPRAGAAVLCERLATLPLDCIVYVSCDPATFERDAKILLAGGYRIQAARWAEMFPQTVHMELLALFVRD